MTNKEKYRDQIEDIIMSGHFTWGVTKDGKIKPCKKFDDCTECIFDKDNNSEFDDKCSDLRQKWLKEEYKDPEVDWSKVKVDTKVLVSDTGIAWHKYYFYKYEDEKVYTFHNGATSWSNLSEKGVVWNYVKLADDNESEE